MYFKKYFLPITISIVSIPLSGQKNKHLDCFRDLCDTVNTHHLYFTLHGEYTEDSSHILWSDTLNLPLEVTGIVKYTFWVCGYCSGRDTIDVTDEKYNKIFDFEITYSGGPYNEAEFVNMDKIRHRLKPGVYCAKWFRSPFYIKIY